MIEVPVFETTALQPFDLDEQAESNSSNAQTTNDSRVGPSAEGKSAVPQQHNESLAIVKGSNNSARHTRVVSTSSTLSCDSFSSVTSDWSAPRNSLRGARRGSFFGSGSRGDDRFNARIRRRSTSGSSQAATSISDVTNDSSDASDGPTATCSISLATSISAGSIDTNNTSSPACSVVDAPQKGPSNDTYVGDEPLIDGICVVDPETIDLSDEDAHTRSFDMPGLLFGSFLGEPIFASPGALPSIAEVLETVDEVDDIETIADHPDFGLDGCLTASSVIDNGYENFLRLGDIDHITWTEPEKPKSDLEILQEFFGTTPVVTFEEHLPIPIGSGTVPTNFEDSTSGIMDLANEAQDDDVAEPQPSRSSEPELHNDATCVSDAANAIPSEPLNGHNIDEMQQDIIVQKDDELFRYKYCPLLGEYLRVTDNDEAGDFAYTHPLVDLHFPDDVEELDLSYLEISDSDESLIGDEPTTPTRAVDSAHERLLRLVDMGIITQTEFETAMASREVLGNDAATSSAAEPSSVPNETELLPPVQAHGPTNLFSGCFVPLGTIVEVPEETDEDMTFFTARDDDSKFSSDDEVLGFYSSSVNVGLPVTNGDMSLSYAYHTPAKNSRISAEKQPDDTDEDNDKTSIDTPTINEDQVVTPSSPFIESLENTLPRYDDDFQFGGEGEPML